MRAVRAFLIPFMALSVMTAVSTAAAAQERTWRPDSEGAVQVEQTSSFVSEFDVSDQAVTFRTKGRYAGFVLKVSGPDEFHLEQRVAADAVPRLLLRNKQGMLSDGHYSIELTAQPIIPAEFAAALEQARMSGDRAELRKAMKRAGLEPESMIYSTGVRVMQGRFLDPTVKEAVEGSGGQQIDNSGAATPEAPVQLAAVSDATHQPGTPRPEFVEGPKVTSAALTRTLQEVQANPLPEFIAAQADPNTPWTRASFQNRTDQGSVALDGYLRPVVAETYGDEPLIQAYFRQAGADGQGFGPWLEAYFEPTLDGGFRLVRRATVEQPASLFDYTVSEEPVAPMPDQVILDDLIVDGSICAGFDCVNGESFGFDTIRMKENNLRLKAQDTSSTASFPTNDWQLTFNDTSNGGQNKFSVDDIDGGRTPMTIEAGAPSHSLYVDDGGRIGLGTSTPVVEVHVVDGDSPTMRLEQDGSSGFTAQTWDVAANETNFFIRDATNGSRLPFRIRPAAPSNSIFIDADGDVGLGTSSPGASLEVEETGATQAKVLVENTGTGNAQIHVKSLETANSQMLLLDHAAGGAPFARFTSGFGNWDFVAGNSFFITDPTTGVNELALSRTGNLTIQGQCSELATGSCADYVFEDGYEMLTLEKLEAYIAANGHLPNVPTTEEIQRDGLVVQHFTGRLLEKIEELVLYTIEQQKVITDMQARLTAMEAKSKP